MSLSLKALLVVAVIWLLTSLFSLGGEPRRLRFGQSLDSAGFWWQGLIVLAILFTFGLLHP